MVGYVRGGRGGGGWRGSRRLFKQWNCLVPVCLSSTLQIHKIEIKPYWIFFFFLKFALNNLERKTVRANKPRRALREGERCNYFEVENFSRGSNTFFCRANGWRMRNSNGPRSESLTPSWIPRAFRPSQKGCCKYENFEIQLNRLFKGHNLQVWHDFCKAANKSQLFLSPLHLEKI